MNIVIITGNIYPFISARSFRATELACGLARLGHHVTLYGLLGNYDYGDFMKKHPNLTIKDLGKSNFGLQYSDGSRAKILDNKIVNLIYRAICKLTYRLIDFPRCEYFFLTYKVLKDEKPFDYLITIAHPFGCHWGAAYYRRYKSKGKFKYWVADCGDPFMGDKDVKRTPLLLKPIEKFWCKECDSIVIPVEIGRNGYYPEFRYKISVIPQSIDFDSIELERYQKYDIPTFFYSGAIYPGVRDPTAFLEYLCIKKQNFRFIVYSGSVIWDKYKQQLGEKLIIKKYIPRKELIKIMSKMDFLINFTNDSDNQVPSKLIDYTLSQRPILNISSSYSENEKVAFEEFLKGFYHQQYIVNDIQRYDTKNVSMEFLKLAIHNEE